MRWACLGALVLLLALAGCAGSYTDVSHRDAEGLRTASSGMLLTVYCDYHKPEQWAELRRRGLVREEYKSLIDAHQIKIGMTENEMQASWGGLSFCKSNTFLTPHVCGMFPASKIMTSSGSHIQWSDGEGDYVYTDNGIITAIQQ